jgi:hypothetical protein
MIVKKGMIYAHDDMLGKHESGHHKKNMNSIKYTTKRIRSGLNKIMPMAQHKHSEKHHISMGSMREYSEVSRLS